MTANPEKIIEHRGYIDRFTGHSVIVKIVSESACAACHAKGACSAAEMQDKEIEVSGPAGNFSLGEIVYLNMKQAQGFKALMIGYVYPFILLFAGLIVLSASGLNELMAGILALGLLPPYYFTLYLLRNKIRREFIFFIRKAD
jgi:sigma-E factor negative regulatory protein RseC